MSANNPHYGSLSLDGRIAIVTGGGNGMGERSSHTLAARGAKVVILEIDAGNAERVVNAIAAEGGEAEFISADATNEDEITEALQTVMAHHGRIDVLNNNAAALGLTGEDFAVDDTSFEVFMDTLRANVGGPFLMTQKVIPFMLENGGGSIVNIASVSGLIGEPNLTAYGVSKAGVIQLTRAIATQYGPRGIRCNAIAPSYVTTPNNEMYAPPELSKAYLHCTPTNRLSEPQDIAEVVAFLASDSSRQINGHLLPVDGGLIAATAVNAALRESLKD